MSDLPKKVSATASLTSPVATNYVPVVDKGEADVEDQNKRLLLSVLRDWIASQLGIATGGTGFAKNKNNATAAPTATDDSSEGYGVLSVWGDTTNDKVYVCVDATENSAVWLQISNEAEVLNKFDATADPAVGDDSGDGYAVGSTWINVTDKTIWRCTDASSGAALWERVDDDDLLNKFDATTDPTVGDDSADGYSVGSTWINVTDDKIFECLDASAGAAVWSQTNAPGGSVNYTDGSVMDGDRIDIDFTPTNYTPDATAPEADDVDDLAAHLKGIDNKLAGVVQNNFVATTDPAAGDDTGDGYAVGSTWINTTEETIWRCTDASSAAALWERVDDDDLLNNLDASTDPTVGDDSGDGYSVGSTWINVTDDKIFECLDASSGAAVWAQTNAPGGAVDYTDGSVVDGDQIDIDYTPAGYTPDATATEAADADDLAAHLKGISNAIAGLGGGVLNNYVATTDPTAGDDTGDGYAVGSTWINTTDETIWRCTDASSAAALWERVDDDDLKHNFVATTDPVAGDDSGDGYSVGSTWINVTDDKIFECLDASSGAAVWSQTNAASSAASYFRGYIDGFECSNNGADGDHDLDIAVGGCRDSDDGYDIELGSALTKRLDASWAAGTGNGMLDTGSIDSDATYFIYAIANSGTDAVDILASTSASSPTMPSGYDKKRMVFAVLTDSSSNIIPFHAYGAGREVHVRWDSVIYEMSTTISNATFSVLSLTAPNGISTRVTCRFAKGATGSTGLIIYDGLGDDLVPVATNVNAVSSDIAGSAQPRSEKDLWTNTSGQVKARASASESSVTVHTFGFMMPR